MLLDFDPTFVRAIRLGDVDTVRDMLKDVDVNARYEGGGLTYLRAAVCFEQSEIVDMLIAAGADVNIYGGGHDTPLSTAVRQAIQPWRRATRNKGVLYQSPSDKLHPEHMAAKLLRAGADASLSVWDTEPTLLYPALKNGLFTLAEIMFESDVDINAKNRKGDTVLDILKKERGAFVDSEFPVHVREAITWLLTHGATE